MLAFDSSHLNRQYTLINVLKALASIISMCDLHVTFLLKITPRYFKLFTNGMFRPFSLRWDAGGRRLCWLTFPDCCHYTRIASAQTAYKTPLSTIPLSLVPIRRCGQVLTGRYIEMAISSGSTVPPFRVSRHNI
jgi:hypothetical protein